MAFLKHKSIDYSHHHDLTEDQMNLINSGYSDNQVNSNLSPLKRNPVNPFGYQIRLLTALTLGAIAAVGWWFWPSEPKYLGKFYLLLAPIPQNQTDSLTEYSKNELEFSTQTALMRNPQVLQPVLAKLSLPYSNFSESATSPLTIKRLEQTPIVEVTYEDRDPLKIEQVLKNLASVYLDYGMKSQQNQSPQQSRLIQKELSQINQRLSQSQQQLDTFRTSYNLYNPEQQAKILSEQLAKLEMDSYQTKMQLQEMTTLYQSLKQQLNLTPEQVIASTDLSTSPYYQNLVKQLHEVNLELAQKSSVFLADSPVIQELKDKQKNLQDLIQQEQAKIPKDRQGQIQVNSSPNALRLSLNQQYIQAANNVQVLQSREKIIDEQIQSLKSQIEKIPALSRRYTELQQQFNREQSSLNNYLTAQNQARKETVKSSSWQLLSKPQLSKVPTSPDPQKNLVLGLLSGASLGLLTSILLESLLTPLLRKKN